MRFAESVTCDNLTVLVGRVIVRHQNVYLDIGERDLHCCAADKACHGQRTPLDESRRENRVIKPVVCAGADRTVVTIDDAIVAEINAQISVVVDRVAPDQGTSSIRVESDTAAVGRN